MFYVSLVNTYQKIHILSEIVKITFFIFNMYFYFINAKIIYNNNRIKLGAHGAIFPARFAAKYIKNWVVDENTDILTEMQY